MNMKNNYFVKLKLFIIIINLLLINKKKDLFYKKRIEILRKGKSYINKCLKSLFFTKNKNKTKLSNIPLISVVIPIYNCKKTILPTIRSIQNQNFSEFEIILVNDYSSDNTSGILDNLQNEDSRIIILNNNKNMGTLYSRCIGVLNSKGKYIFPLDNDDMFFDEDVFDFIYKKAIDGNYDIVEFKTMMIRNYKDDIRKIKDHPFSNHKNNLILHQPELGLFPIFYNGTCRHFDINIWGKSIKSEIYKKSVKNFGVERYSNYITWGEDTSMVFVLLNTAQSFLFIHKYGVIHLNSPVTASFTQSEDLKIFAEIYIVDTFFDFSKGNNISTNCIAELVLQKTYLKTIKTEKNILYLKSLLNKIINSNYTTKFNKEKILGTYDNFFNILNIEL